jgi:hypothetical protein
MRATRREPHIARQPSRMMSGYEPTRDQLYGWRWRKARKLYLARHPRCRMCQAQGKLAAATVVDHIRPHKSNPVLFWDQSNWPGSMRRPPQQCQAGAREESGKMLGIGVDGAPTHPDHPWNNLFHGGGSKLFRT